MSRAYRLTACVDGSAWARTPDGTLLGRVDRLNDAWVAALPASDSAGGLLSGEDLPSVFPTRSAAAEALLRHHEGQP